MPIAESRPTLLSEYRIEGVDALRGVAAMYVFLYHLALIPQPSLAVPSWAARYVLTGGTGVTLFLIISTDFHDHKIP
jgi:peptidoglycan/LPS O-acetylase OafA/YrhL